jgi:hypothetical protein
MFTLQRQYNPERFTSQGTQLCTNQMRLPIDTAATLHQHSKRGRVAIEIDIEVLQIGTTDTLKAEPFKTNSNPWTEIDLRRDEENIYAELEHRNSETPSKRVTLRQRLRSWFRRLCCVER